MSEQGITAFDRLEELVKRAGEEIERLRTENESLTAQVARLSEKADVAIEWEGEREQVADRVAALVDGLEELLEVAEGDAPEDD